MKSILNLCKDFYLIIRNTTKNVTDINIVLEKSMASLNILLFGYFRLTKL